MEGVVNEYQDSSKMGEAAGDMEVGKVSRTPYLVN